MDRIVLCGRREEDPGYLLSAHLFPQAAMEYIVWVLAWIHICMIVAVLKFASIWHRSTLYVWYLCTSLSLLHMDLRCILVAMFICFPHGYSLYWFASMMRNHLVLSKKVLMYCRILVDNDLRSSDFFPWSDNLLFQISCLSYPSRLMLLGAFCYT